MTDDKDVGGHESTPEQAEAEARVYERVIAAIREGAPHNRAALDKHLPSPDGWSIELRYGSYRQVGIDTKREYHGSFYTGCLSEDEARARYRNALPSVQENPPFIHNEQDALLHPVSQVYFRAGLIACREYMARFVEAESPSIAMSIRANWWPSLGPDVGPPRKLDFSEVTSGTFGTPDFRIKNAGEVSPTQEALPIALGFLESLAGDSTRLLSEASPSVPSEAQK